MKTTDESGIVAEAGMAKAMRVYLKQQVDLDPRRLSFQQIHMAKLGFVALKEIKDRTARGQGPNDGPAKPLSKKWAAIKRNMGLKPIRDLRGPGRGVRLAAGARRKKAKFSKAFHMLDNTRVSTVTNNTVRIAPTTEQARIKANRNQRREPWLVLSPHNHRVVTANAQDSLNLIKDKMVKVSRPAA